MPAGTGDVFLLSGCTHGSFQQLPALERQKVLLMGGGFGRVYLVCEEIVDPDKLPPQRIFVFEDYSPYPSDSQAFANLTEDLREIKAGKEHLLALTANGQVFSSGRCEYGSVGIGGRADAAELIAVPALRGKKVRHIGACAYSSLAITADGDVYAWGTGFRAETGNEGMQVATVPRFCPALSKLRILQVACGDAHCLARTEMQTCAVWGDNTCGQLGIGAKTVPMTSPVILEAVTNVRMVAAGWAHSVALQVEPATHVYTWGLNSHGQLGLGDTRMRRSPELIQLFSQRELEVEDVAANRASTVFTTKGQAWLAGRFPILPPGVTVAVPEVLPGVPSRLELGSTDLPRRTTEMDPSGCVLTPLPVEFQKQLDPLAPPTEGAVERVAVRSLVASDRHVIAFVPAAVVKVNPCLSPLEGGIRIHVFCTGLASDIEEVFGTLSADDTLGVEERMEDDPKERFKVRLVCQKPECDVVVKARCIGKNRLIISSPDLSLSPIAPRAHRGPVHLAVQVSMDGGLSWTEDAGVRLTYMEYPRAADGIDPECAPVVGGTNLRISVPGLKYPEIPTEDLTVKFVCRPKPNTPPSLAQQSSPYEQDLAGAYVDLDKSLSKYPPVGDLNIFAYGTYSYRDEVIEVLSPPFDVTTFQYYDITVDVSLDGKRYFQTPLQFQLYDLKIVALSPNCGPLDDTTTVTPVTQGLIKSSRNWCRAEFPPALNVRQDLPGEYNHAAHEITFAMPSLKQQVAQRVEVMRAELPELIERVPEDEEDGAADKELPQPEVDPDGGLGGLRVPVELTLNLQNYTDDRVEFVYYGTLGLSEFEVQEGVDKEQPLPVDTEILLPIANLPEGMDVPTAVVTFKVLSPSAEPPEEGEAPALATEEANVPAVLHYRGVDAVLVAAVPPILQSRVEGAASAKCMLELSLNRQHYMPVPGLLPIELRPDPEPPADA